MSDVNNSPDELKEQDENVEEPTVSETVSEEPTNNTDADDTPQDGEAAEAVDISEGTNLMQALIEAQKEAQTNKDGWQRARAEFANYKKRVEREKSEMFQRASLDTLKALLPIIDDFDRAFDNIPEEINDNPWIGGVSMIQRKFESLLDKYEIEPINPAGEPFDPNYHEAVGTEDSDEVESGHVTVTLQKGYRAGEQVLRPALVRVAS
jgi:molecular chaperone GrpE